MTVQAGLCHTLSETPRTGFLASRLSVMCCNEVKGCMTRRADISISTTRPLSIYYLTNISISNDAKTTLKKQEHGIEQLDDTLW